MVKNKSILGSRHPTPSRAAFRRLPLLTATTRRSRLKTQSRLLRSSRARSRSIRRLKFKPNSRRQPTRHSLPSHRRLPHCTAILPSRPTSHSVTLLQRRPRQIDKFYPATSEHNCPAHRGASVLSIDWPPTRGGLTARAKAYPPIACEAPALAGTEFQAFVPQRECYR